MPQEATGKTGMPSQTRNKPERPRDRLGRPLDWEAENELELEDYDSFSIERNHELGLEYVRTERYFPAHEAWETAWKQARGTDEAEFFKGLSQMGAGYVHLQRGNAHGTITLLRRASGRIASYPDGHRGISTRSLHDRLEADAAAVERGDLVPGATVTFDPPDV
jgi:predicted metal-dependent hydrolase